MVDQYNKRKVEKMTGKKCDVCDTPLYSDPSNWDYETSLPEWALPPPGYDGATEPTKESDPLAIDLQKLKLEDARNVCQTQFEATSNNVAGTGISDAVDQPVAASAAA
ncbi:pseudouridine synthase [Pyrenophora tritici-repentis]|uniref:Pseudouridine synthase n=2 Tax=Pyrenophora tritici-repentis TaxID=45151 RepID=A0A2W1FQ76_9PLEO|nr:uncharacterized protein PTRG_12105 [Pyrenophora tritici-repentis Pt-1C-BFP]KAA8623767.1 Pseudouridine synthase [Pyrenophora tritici-repentis]EDU47290.1 predicted protein [Pyrenophora tritici-repentis Pt-1C-BFP]KAF7574046.1 hypothetical protein PtrM4_056690 [Pyrenophora tritici-repentis]KAI0569623.1 Pseudouridine synthase [Pyrenophora tritici-repentis]KAI1508871.1 Pseudouridine synthase [Pyrenophora tritici-repentis]